MASSVATSTAAPAGELRHGVRDDALAALANRIGKNHRHWSRWARRRGLGAYRIYDRDIPEFPLAIDCYVAEDAAIGTRFHLQEVETGWHATPAEHAAWREAVIDAAAGALAVPPSALIMKARPKRRGREQHEKHAGSGTDFVIGESGLRFLVNLEAYLDTG